MYFILKLADTFLFHSILTNIKKIWLYIEGKDIYQDEWRQGKSHLKSNLVAQCQGLTSKSGSE